MSNGFGRAQIPYFAQQVLVLVKRLNGGGADDHADRPPLGVEGQEVLVCPAKLLASNAENYQRRSLVLHKRVCILPLASDDCVVTAVCFQRIPHKVQECCVIIDDGYRARLLRP